MKKFDTFQTFARGAKSLVAILLVMLMAVGSLFAQTTYTYTFTAKVWSNAGTQSLSDVSWTVDGTIGGQGNSYYGYDTKGQQFGSGSNPFTSLTITTDDIPGTITSITVNTSGANSINATFKVKVGDTYFMSGDANTITLTNTATDYTFTGSSEGEISLEWEQTSSKAIYWKSITVVYESTTPTVEIPTWVTEDQVAIFNTQVNGLVPTFSVNDNNESVFHFAYTDAFQGYPAQNPSTEMGANPSKVYVDMMIKRPNADITGVKVSYGPGHEEIIDFTDVTDPYNGTLGNPYYAVLSYFPVATVFTDGTVVGNPVDKSWTVDVEWCIGTEVVDTQYVIVKVDAAPGDNWVACEKVGVFNTQVDGLVPTCSTVGDSTVFHFAYTDAFNGFPEQTPNQEMGGNPAKVYVDVRISRPNDDITGVKVSYGPGHEEIINFTEVTDPNNGTLGHPYDAVLAYFPVATVNADGSVTGNTVDRNWTIDVEWCVNQSVVCIQKLNVMVDAAPLTPAVDTWVSCDQVDVFNTQVTGLVPTCATVGDSTVFHFAYNEDFEGFPAQTPNQEMGGNPSKVYVDVMIKRPNENITGVKVSYGPGHEEILNFTEVTDPNNGTLGHPYDAILYYFPVATVNADGSVTGNTVDRNWTVDVEWCVGTEVVATQYLNVMVDAAPAPVLPYDTVAELPYVNNFDEGIDPYFVIENGENTNKWYINQAQTFDNNKLYISSNGGTTNKYDITKASIVTAYRDVMIPETGAVLSFDYRVNGEAGVDYMLAELIFNDEITEIGTYYGDNEWKSVNYSISGEMAGVVRVQFTWNNNNSQGNQFPAAIDNISVIETPCSQPTALTAAVDSTTAVITWKAAEGQTAWNLEYKLADHSEWYTIAATDTFVTLTDLQGNSDYMMRVQAVCGEEEVSAWTNGTFAVACQTLVTEEAEATIGAGTITTNVIPVAGYFYHSYNQQLFTEAELAENGIVPGSIINSLSFNYTYATSTVRPVTMWLTSSTVTSLSSAFVSINGFTQVFSSTCQEFNNSNEGWNTIVLDQPFTYTGGSLVLATLMNMEDAEDATTCFTTYSNTARFRYTSNSGKARYYNVDKVSGSYVPITFTEEGFPKTTGSALSGSSYAYRNNIKFNVVIPQCLDEIACVAPTALEVSDITANSAVLTWAAGAEGQTAFIVEYMAEDATEWTSVNVEDTTYTLTELAQLTNYSVKVKANCGTNNWSEVITTSFRTAGICAPVTNLETSNMSNTTTLTWTAGGEENAWLVQFKPASEGEDAWTSINVNMLPMTTFGGLVGNTDYDVRVKALCDPNDTENQSEWTSTAFHSGCAAFEIPFVEEFPTNTMPICWENQNFLFASSGYAYTNTNGAELITPAINIPAENPTYLAFEVRGSGNYTVLASYRGTRADRFTEIYTGTAPTQNTVVTIALDDLYKGRAVNFKIVNNSTSYQYFYFVNVNQCPFEATALNTSNVTGTTVDLAWEADEAAANFQVQYGEQGFTVGEGTTVDVTDTTAITISELSYETAYDFYVRVACGGDNSEWAGPISATTATACSEITNLEYEFIGTGVMLTWEAGEWGTPSSYNIRYKSSRDDEYTTVTTTALFTTISNLYSNTVYEFGIQTVCSNNYTSEWFTINTLTPCTNSCNLVFTLTDQYSDSWNGASVDVYQDGYLLANVTCPSDYGTSNPYTETVAICKGSEINLVWNTGSFDNECSMIITHNGTEIYNAGAPESGTFATFLACPNCSAPYALAANNVTSTSAELTWIDNNETGTYTIEYRTSEETEWTRVEGITDTTYTLEDLSEKSIYYVRVMTVCGYNDESTWTDSISFMTPCINSCNLVFTLTDSYGDGWNNASIDVYQDGSLLATVTCPENYKNPNLYIDTVVICKGSEINLVWNTGSYDSECSMVITHAGVEIYNGGAPSGTFATFEACPTCFAPSALAATSEGVVTWESINENATFVVEYKVDGATEWTSATADTTTYTIDNLELSTTYWVRVKADCGAGDESDWSNEVSFTTPVCAGGASATITGTSASSSYLPTYSLYNYSLTQQIYLSSEMNMPQGASLTSMTFTVNTLKNRNISVYLAHTTESEFTTSNTFLTLNDAVLVYSGPAFETAGDYVITFTQPFNYNGTDNLVLMVDDNTGSWSSGLSVAQHSATNMSMRIYSDGVDYDVNSVSSYSGTRMSNRNDVVFLACPPQPEPTCFVPSNLTVSEVSDHSAVVTWADNHNQDNYALEYRADNENGWHVVSVDTTYYLLSNLDASTDYLVRVKAVCDAEDESVYTDVVEFTTVCEHGVEIAFNGTSTSYYVPSYGNYNYGFSQQIYKSSEINAAATISGFEIEVSNTGAKARTIDIYMMHTSENTITSWLPMDNAQLVYSGVVTFTQGWQLITFDSPFNYNGTDNLVLIVDDNTGSYGNYPTFRTNNGGTNCSRYFYSDGTNFNPFNPTTASTQSSTSTRNNIRFTYCPDPIDLVITDINTFADACEVEGAVTINVKSLGFDGAVSTFEAYYQVNEETPVHETVTLATPIAKNETAEYTFSNLPVFAAGANTLTAWVELEGDAVEANNSIVTEVTVLEPTTVPYVETFTGLTINQGWNPIDANHDGITMDLNNDINYSFNDEAAADDWMMSPCIDMPAGVYTVSYEYKANSAMTESFEVYYGNGAHIADMTNALATHTFNNTTAETVTHTITVAEAGVYNFGFHATSLAGNLGFSIDNFKIYPVNDVIVTFDTNGTVTPNGTIAVNYGENLTLNLVPKPMYHVAGVWVDSVQVVPEDGTGANFMLYTLENVTEPHTVFVDFKLEFHIIKSVENYRPDLYADFGGAFEPAATDTTIDPSAFTVKIVADPHYFLTDLTLSPMVPDGEAMENVFDDVVDNGDGTYNYTIDTLVVANYYLNAVFRRDTVDINYNVLTGKGYAHDSQLLDATDADNNSYTTWVDYSVNHDVDTTVTFHTDAPYHLVDVIVNGESQGRIDSYTFEDVTESQNVDIKFGYRIDAFVSNYNTYDSITDIMGTITPDTQYVAEYDPMLVIGTVEEHFHLYQFFVNGEDRISEVVFGSDPHYYYFTMDSIADNYTIEAVVKVDTFAITYNVLAGQGYADASGLLVEGDSYSTIVNYADNWYSNIEPATGYSIENVTLDGQNLYTANNYQFNYIEESHVFDITFVANTYTVATNAYGNGTVSDGITFIYDPENAVDYEFTATPAEGYYIASVTINNEAMEITDVDNFTYTIENVADNYTINVIFQMYTYTMTATVNPTSTLEGDVYGGTITPSGTQTVNYGADVTYTINANEGWYIYYVTVDGVNTNYTQADGLNTLDVPFTNINDNHEVEVGFLRYKYDITAAIDGDVHGAINEFFTSLTEVVYYGENFSMTFDADNNYQVADVVIDGEDMGAITSYEFVNVTANHTVVVSFEAIMYTLTATSNVDACAITPATTTVQAGSDVNYTLTVANGYHLENVLANGEEVVVTNNAFTISNVQSDYTIYANFASNYVTVTVDQPEHATITPGTQTFAYGATPSYMIVPEVGYDVVSVTAGNAVVNVTYNNGIGSFTLDPVHADITLTATTAKKQFTITVATPTNGVISPAATQTVEYGDNITFTITPNQYYTISDVIVDGSSRGQLSSYTFYNVTSNHSIAAEFESACYMPTNLTAFNIDTTSAELTWVGNAPSYEVRYKAADDAAYTVQTVNTNSVQLTGLTPGTLYAWGVRAICGSNLSSEWAINGFTTKNSLPSSISSTDMSSINVYSYLNNVYIVNEEGIAISNVDIYDIYGKQVYTGKVLNSPEVISLNVANGNYVVRLATENGVGVYKVVIVR